MSNRLTRWFNARAPWQKQFAVGAFVGAGLVAPYGISGDSLPCTRFKPLEQFFLMAMPREDVIPYLLGCQLRHYYEANPHTPRPAPADTRDLRDARPQSPNG